MIAIAVDTRPTYLPVSTEKLTNFFGGLIRNGISRSTNNCMFATNAQKHTVQLWSEMPFEAVKHCDSLRFDFPDLEDAFDCEFVEMPSSIQTAKDFRKWIMEMNLE